MNCQYFNTLTLRATLPGGGDFLLVRSRRSVGRVSCVLVYTPFKKHATLISNQKHLQKEHASLVPSRGHRAPLPRCKTLKLCWRDDLQILTSGGENIPLVRKKRINTQPQRPLQSARVERRTSLAHRPGGFQSSHTRGYSIRVAGYASRLRESLRASASPFSAERGKKEKVNGTRHRGGPQG